VARQARLVRLADYIGDGFALARPRCLEKFITGDECSAWLKKILIELIVVILIRSGPDVLEMLIEFGDDP